MPPWWRWAVWCSPMYYAQKVPTLFEFLENRSRVPCLVVMLQFSGNFESRLQQALRDNNSSYTVQAISINEFHAPRWATPYQARTGETLYLGRAILGATDLDSYGLFIVIGIGALICYVLFYNVVVCIAMKKLSCKALSFLPFCGMIISEQRTEKYQRLNVL